MTSLPRYPGGQSEYQAGGHGNLYGHEPGAEFATQVPVDLLGGLKDTRCAGRGSRLGEVYYKGGSSR